VSGTELGQEIDLVAHYNCSTRLDLQAVFDQFFPGTFIRNTGPSPNADRCYFPLPYKL
jgi:hypothetical protein